MIPAKTKPDGHPFVNGCHLDESNPNLYFSEKSWKSTKVKIHGPFFQLPKKPWEGTHVFEATTGWFVLGRLSSKQVDERFGKSTAWDSHGFPGGQIPGSPLNPLWRPPFQPTFGLILFSGHVFVFTHSPTIPQKRARKMPRIAKRVCFFFVFFLSVNFGNHNLSKRKKIWKS